METTSIAIKERKLDEYDVTFVGGHMITVSICHEEGDEIDWSVDKAIRFKLVAKRGLTTEGTLELPPEDITIFRDHILAIQHRTRVIQPITAEQKAEWDKAMRNITKTVQ